MSVGRVVLAGAAMVALALPGAAQQVDYGKPQAHFPNPFAPYIPRTVGAPNLTNTARIDPIMKDGKLMLSMNDAIALALENNLDIAIARYNLDIADTDLLRAKSGGTTRGVNTGVVQNTPGGGVGAIGSSTSGSGAGGTSSGTGGAGSGTSGIVTSTSGVGSVVSSFDPVLTGTLQLEHSKTLNTFPLFDGPTTSRNTGTVNFGYQQGFQTGTNMSLSFDNSRTTTTSTSTVYSPAVNSNFRFTLSQHLLQGFGFLPNRRFIITAKNNRQISDAAFRLQVITTVNQIQNIYWDLVNAYEDVKVKERSVALANKTLSDNKKQVEIGTLAPIEVVRAQSDASTREQDLIVSQTNLELQQLLMKNALTRSLKDPVLATAEVIPVSTMDVPAEEPVTPIEDLINEAVRHRAELVESRIDLNSRDLSNKAVRSSLLPTLDLYAYYGGAGLGGSQNPTNLCANQPLAEQSAGFCAGPNGATTPPGQTLVPIAPTTSYAGTLNQLINSTASDKGVGISLNIPLRNRAAQAVQIRSELEYRQAQMRLQQIENQVGVEVRNAQYAVQQNRASVDSAKAAVELGHQSLEAEQKKFQFGTSTNTLVLQFQSQLATAESTLVNAMVAYEKSRVELDRATGQLLDHAGISIDDAARGQVTRMPNVPYIAPRKDTPAVSQPTPQASAPQQQPQ